MTEPFVHLVGAGPGNPGLVTVRAVECLAHADLVIYDKLVPPRVLDYAPPSAERVCVRELTSYHGEPAPRIVQRMIDAARAGRRVVRLKGGDPFIFGRGGEEAEALRDAGIAYEVVPGVTAALGAAAYAGIPLTHRALASAVAFVTGHENPAKPASALDWPALARFPGTLAIYMGMAHLPQLVGRLLEVGKPPRTPAAAIHWATTGEQRTVEAPLEELPAAVQASGLTAPAILFVGAVAALRGQLGWFEQGPLFGKRVLVTRPRDQAGPFVRRLEQSGAVPVLLPCVEIAEPDDWSEVDRALHRLGDYQWVVFTSSNGVHALLRRLRKLGRDVRALGSLRLAAIGPSTAEALRGYYLEPDLVPEEYCSESLAARLRREAAGQRILLARADRGRDVLRQELAEVAQVDQIAVYVQRDAVEDAGNVLDGLRRGELDFITFTSGNIARAFLRKLDGPCLARLESGHVKIVTISPVTSTAVAEFGLPVAAEAGVYTTEGMLEALTALAAREEKHALT